MFLLLVSIAAWEPRLWLLLTIFFLFFLYELALKIPSCKYNEHDLSMITLLCYRLPYNAILGGVVAIRSDLFVKVNGYSNQFFGWGGEDDDFSARCRRRGVQLVRYPKTIARYKMIHHDKDSGNEANPNR